MLCQQVALLSRVLDVSLVRSCLWCSTPVAERSLVFLSGAHLDALAGVSSLLEPESSVGRITACSFRPKSEDLQRRHGGEISRKQESVDRL